MTCAVDIGSDALLLHGLRITGPITDCRTTSNDASQTVQQGVGVARAPVQRMPFANRPVAARLERRLSKDLARPTHVGVTFGRNHCIYIFGFKYGEQGLRSALVSFQAYIRMQREKVANGLAACPRKQISDIAERKSGHGSTPEGQGLLLQSARAIQQLPGFRQKQSSTRVGPGSARCPFEKSESQLIFEPCNLAAQRRLLDLETPCGPRKAALFGCGQNIGEMTKVNHAHMRPCRSRSGERLAFMVHHNFIDLQPLPSRSAEKLRPGRARLRRPMASPRISPKIRRWRCFGPQELPCSHLNLANRTTLRLFSVVAVHDAGHLHLVGGGTVSFRQYARQNLAETVHTRRIIALRTAFFQTVRLRDSLGNGLLLSPFRRVP